MASLLIHDVDDALHARLEARAAARGRSVEEEALQALRDGLDAAADPVPADEDLWSAMRAIFAPLGGVELEIGRQPGERPPPDFSGPEWDLPADPAAAAP